MRPIARLWSRIRGDSVISVLARGAVSGLAGFCAGPILGAVLTVAAGSGQPLHGAALHDGNGARPDVAHGFKG